MNPEDLIRIKELLPTSLGSAEIREEFSKEILQRSIFSAKMESARYLHDLREVLTEFVGGRINAATAREQLLTSLATMGVFPGGGDGIADPAGRRRLDLILKTQKQMAASVADLKAQTPDILARWPAWELLRYGSRDQKREDWPARWHFAGEACGWDGAIKTRMVALKSSPIWQKLGDGEGGFDDTLGNAYPPFAFNSGLAWADVSAERCAELGLTVPESQPIAEARVGPDAEEVREVADRLGFSAEDFE